MTTLNFKGKSFVQNHHLAVKYHQLVPQKGKSLTGKISLHDNLIIQGDNLNREIAFNILTIFRDSCHLKQL